jgi:UDP-GlcNAc:undecaprenyl-phosphate/decaprenyl-phosphate GlcNAc-1-phosphate transferase
MEIFNRLYIFLLETFTLLGVEASISFCVFIFALSLAIHFLILYYRQSLSPVPFIFKRLILINAEKSEAGALQVGGLVFSVVLMFAIYMILAFFPQLLTNNQAKILEVASHSWIGILIYGYLDDRMELRPIVKLALQLGAVFLFCLRVSNVIYPEHSAIAFIVLTVLSSIIINGSNLLDGLDTLTYKVSSVIFLIFMILATVHQNAAVLFLSAVFFMIMSGFYFYNREPSRVHMGETGVGSLGFSYVVLGTLLFETSIKTEESHVALAQCLIPSILPIVEIGTSFLRRILNNKSPFKGDKLHIHHILHLKSGFSASASSTIIAGTYLFFFYITLLLVGPTFPISSIFIMLGITLCWYLGVGYRIWFYKTFTFDLSHIQGFLLKKKIRIIPSNILSDFKIVVNTDQIDERKTQDPEK